MKRYIAKTYKPAELLAAIEVLQKNAYHSFSENDAKGIVTALHQRGYRIVKTGEQPT